MAVSKKRIVIIGASFAGLAAANAISRRYDVTVLDPRRDFEWTPNIHEILSGVKSERDVVLDRQSVIERFGHRFVQDAVTRLDVERREAVTDSGARHGYEACIVAVGGVRDRQGIPGAAKHSIDFRSAADALAIERELDSLLGTGRPVSVVIIGGGVSGVEAVGELLRRHGDDSDLSIHVVEREDEILPGLPAALARDVRERAADDQVHWHTGAGVRRIGEDAVMLEGGDSLAADLVIWSAGLSPPPFLREASLIPSGHDWVPVEQSLQSPVSAEIFVAGDCAELPSPLRKQAYHAIDMGEYAAYNVQHYLRDRPLKAFRPSDKPLLIAFGDRDTYLVAGDLVVASRYLAAAKEGVYQYYMARMSLVLPPARLSRGIATRLLGSLRNLVLPEIASCDALSRIRNSRIVSKPAA